MTTCCWSCIPPPIASRDGNIFLKNFAKKEFFGQKSSAEKGTFPPNARFVNKLNPELRRDKLEPHELRALFTYYD